MQVGKGNLPATTYTADQQKYHSCSIVAVYVVETIGTAPESCSWLKIDLTVEFPNFVTYKNNNNTMICKIWIINIRLRYYEKKYGKYNENKRKHMIL